MFLSQDDRIAFSLKMVSIDQEIAGITQAQTLIQGQSDKIQKLDTANKHLFDPVNAQVDSYHPELNQLTGQQHTSIVEQDIVDAANKILQNHFFPNDPTVSVPSLNPYNNVWTKFQPFALTFALGKNYQETYSVIPKEGDLITTILGYITAAGSYTDIQNTTGQECVATGMCSNILYTDQATCVLNGGIWTPGPDSIISFPAVQTLKTNIVAAVNSLVTFLTAEVALIVTNDVDSGRQTLNNAAINNINNVIIPALNTWLGYADFNTAHGQSTCAGFNGYNANLLAPTKLHSAQLAALLSALNSRTSFITTRISQLQTYLGTIVQDLTTGETTSSSGFYGKRFSYLSLRLNTVGGSLTQLAGLQSASSAQSQIKTDLVNTKNIYDTVLSVSRFGAAGTGTSTVNLVDASFLSPGDTVYIVSETQDELLRAVKSVNGKAVTLNDQIPSKYRPNEKARLYKVLI